MKKVITDKTLAAFEKWYFENHCKSSIKFEDLLLWQKSEVFDWLYSQFETIQYAFAIEFFDSVGIFISINYVSFYDELRNDKGFEAYVSNNGISTKFRQLPNRKEATSEAFEKANEIFNKR